MLFYKDMSNLVCPKCNKEFKTNPGFNKHIDLLRRTMY